MKRASIGFAMAGLIGALMSLGVTGQAQSVRDVRLDAHSLGMQVGVVTQAQGESAWIKTPKRLGANAKVEFTFFSDGGDVLYTGKIAWASPVAPFEAYVTEIKPVGTYHDMNPQQDLYSVAAISKVKKRVGSRPLSDGMAGTIAIGTFARTAVAPPAAEMDGEEPFRAHLGALKSRPGKSAARIVAAMESALSGEIDVDSSALYEKLLPFKKLNIEDPITAKTLSRLFALLQERSLGKNVPVDFLRSPDFLLNQTIGAGQGMRRP